MRNLDNSRQAVESPKSWNSMSYIFQKNIFLQLKHYIQRIYLTLLQLLVWNSPNSLCHFWNHKLFFRTQLFCIILAQTLHTFDKNIPWKCKFSDFPLLELKFIRVLISFFKQRMSFSSKFGSLFSVMRDNSSALF